MKSDVLLSVIIPVWNREDFIERCVYSVLKANYSSMEIILIDDASTDRTSQICQDLCEKYGIICLIQLQENRGPGAARNAGIKVAKGCWIYFLDSDDVIISENLIKLIDILQRSEDIDFIRVNAFDVSYSGDVAYQYQKIDNGVDIDEYLYVEPQVWLYLFNNYHIQKFGILFPETYLAEDSAFVFMAILSAKKGYSFQRPLLRHCTQAHNMISKTVCYSDRTDKTMVCMQTISNFISKHFSGSEYKEKMILYEKTPFGIIQNFLPCMKDSNKFDHFLECIRNESENLNRPIYLCPVNNETIIISKSLICFSNILIDGYCDNNISRKVENYNVLPFNKAVNLKAIIIFVTINARTRLSLTQQLKSLNYIEKYNNGNVIFVYSPQKTGGQLV